MVLSSYPAGGKEFHAQEKDSETPIPLQVPKKHHSTQGICVGSISDPHRLLHQFLRASTSPVCLTMWVVFLLCPPYPWAPNIPLPPSLRGSTALPSADLCVCSHWLPADTPSMTTGLDIDPRALQNIIRIIYSLPSLFPSFVCFDLEFLGCPASVCWPSRQCQEKLDQSLISHSHKFCITIAPVCPGDRADWRLKVLSLHWCPIPTVSYRRWPAQGHIPITRFHKG